MMIFEKFSLKNELNKRKNKTTNPNTIILLYLNYYKFRLCLVWLKLKLVVQIYTKKQKTDI